MKIGQLKISKPIENAMREIKDWLDKLGINGLSLDTRYDAKQNIALLRFSYNGKNYDFRSSNQTNCRLNMWAIARVMEYKVRAHLMGIEEFDKAMKAYIQIETTYKGEYQDDSYKAEERNYIILGISPLSSNDEITKAYKNLAKSFHPDMALSEEAKKEFEKRMGEINNAYSEIKKERDI